MKSKLAILGGKPVRGKPFARYVSTGKEEEDAVVRVVRSGVLSGFYGSDSPEFYGGQNVQALEAAWAKKFGSAHAVAMNSATSALTVALGAAGISPGDEVIVTPYSMSATATAIVLNNGIPVFSDIEDEYFGLDPKKIEGKITKKTRAIMTTNLFGHGSRLEELRRIADRHGLVLIEDCAQSPGAIYKGRQTGTWGHIGVFSLNCHKNIQTGEGGMLVTDDPKLAKRSQLIRNHAEAVIGSGMAQDDLSNMVGRNYRMTELEAAVGIEQLKKLDSLNDARRKLCDRLTDGLSGITGIVPPKTAADSTHSFYLYPVKVDAKKIGVSSKAFASALAAEGAPFRSGYIKPIYMLPMFQKKIAFGREGFPFSLNPGISYAEGICPVTENVEQCILISENITPPNTADDIDQVIEAFAKVADNQAELLGHGKK